ncbi:unnamed protein product [Penicillium glandicola]
MESLPPFSKTSVLVVGGGPTGLTTALLLARYYLQVIVVERHHHRTGQPKAHAINPRSLEIFRQIGLNTVHLRDIGVPAEDGDAVRFVVSMAGKEHGILPYERQGPETLAITPEPLFNIPQPILESFLEKAVAANDKITFYRGVQWDGCSQTEQTALSSNVMERDTANVKIIESDYILDCGGANSRAREQLEIPFSPLPQFIQNEVHHLSVHINADLTRFKPGTLWWVANPLSEGTFICYDRSSSWVFVTYYNPETTSPDKFTDGYCRDLVDNAIGEKVPYEILSITAWSTWPRTAESYQSKRFHHTFVVGDAAHAFPPTGGLGVNTGIADAQNLAWKIHAVERAWADDSVLATYGKERRPVAVANAHQSVKNQVKLRSLKAALRDAPEDRTSSDGSEWQKRLDGELADNAEHFDSIRLQIGYIYGEEISDEPCSLYVPGAIPGSRLPHAWILHDKKRISTLDLVDGTGFVLLLSPGSTDLLSDKVSKIASVPIHTFSVGEDFQVIDESWVDAVRLSSRGLGLLIRPDQHIIGLAGSAEEVGHLLKSALRG